MTLVPHSKAIERFIMMGIGKNVVNSFEKND